jgi:hypothetical protein
MRAIATIPLLFAFWSAPLVAQDNLILQQLPDQRDGIYSDADCDACAGFAQSSGQGFTCDNLFPCEDLVVQQVVIWGGYYPSGVPAAEDSFTVRFHQINTYSGATALLGERVVVPSVRQGTGANVFGVDEYRFVLDLDPPVLIQGRSFLVEVFNETSSGGDSFFWASGVRDPGLRRWDLVWYSDSAPGLTWLPDAIDLSLALHGNTAVILTDGFESGDTRAWQTASGPGDEPEG